MLYPVALGAEKWNAIYLNKRGTEEHSRFDDCCFGLHLDVFLVLSFHDNCGIFRDSQPFYLPVRYEHHVGRFSGLLLWGRLCQSIHNSMCH